MGADMLIQSIGFQATDTFVIDEEWAKSAFAQARKALASIDEARLAELKADLGELPDLTVYKDELLKHLFDVETAVQGFHRQAATVEGGEGIILLLSGGMSWGDSPSELFESMSRLIEANVLPDARWPGPALSQGNPLTRK